LWQISISFNYCITVIRKLVRKILLEVFTRIFLSLRAYGIHVIWSISIYILNLVGCNLIYIGLVFGYRLQINNSRKRFYFERYKLLQLLNSFFLSTKIFRWSLSFLLILNCYLTSFYILKIYYRLVLLLVILIFLTIFLDMMFVIIISSTFNILLIWKRIILILILIIFQLILILFFLFISL
jgi:hypothetical protein